MKAWQQCAIACLIVLALMSQLPEASRILDEPGYGWAVVVHRFQALTVRAFVFVCVWGGEGSVILHSHKA